MTRAREITPFSEKVIGVVRRIPRGRVATYKQVAALAGREHASRGVSWILKSCARAYALPWHRVISSEGRIAFAWGTSKFRLQRRLLLDESVEVDSRHGAVDLGRFQYRRRARTKRPPKGRPRMFG